MTNKKALGKGLGALIGDRRAAFDHIGGEGRLREVPLNAIVPNRRQPRRVFADEELAELATSIQALGVVQPLVVRVLPDPSVAGDTTSGDEAAPAASVARYELIAGERRWRAARLAGLERVPVLVRSADEAMALEIAVAENVAREDLNSIEEAHAYAALVDEFGLTHEQVAGLVGRSRAAVSNILRLLELPDDVQQSVERGDLSEGHGRALLALPDHSQRRVAARHVMRRGFSVRQTEAYVKELLTGGRQPGQAAPAHDPEVSELVDELYGLLQAPVRIRSGRRGGSLQITFRDSTELRRLVDLLRSLRA